MEVVGAGAIGFELGCSRLGSRVTVVELLPQIALTFDVDMAKVAERLLEEQGIAFSLGTLKRDPVAGKALVQQQ